LTQSTSLHRRAVEDADPRRSDESIRFHVDAALFVLAMLMAIALLVVTIYRLPTWYSELECRAGTHGIVLATALALGAIGVFGAIRLCFFLLLAFGARRRDRRRNGPSRECPHVSILVPCFNESRTIEPALESMLELDYPNYEIIVIDDGSTDDTLAKARPFEGTFDGVSVRVFHKANGGKWSALNEAFRRSVGELILCVDADSRLGADSLRRMAAHMEDPSVSVVAGQVRVRNRVNLLTRIQALEYQMGSGVRMGQGFLGMVLVVPGPAGLYRRGVMEEVFRRFGRNVPNDGPGNVSGPYEGDTFAEDFDLSLTALSLGSRIVYEPRAISFTKAPDRAFALISQRYRWTRGSFQVLKKFFARARRDPTLARPGLLAWLGLTYMIDFTVAPITLLLSFGLVVSVFAAGGFQWLFLAWYTAFLLVQLSSGAFFLSLSRDRLTLLAVSPLLDVYVCFLLGSAWIISLVDEFRGTDMRWS